MNEADYQKLKETCWQRALSPDEDDRLRSWLASHPDARAEWEEDISLNGLLGRMPQVPVASNFTSRALKNVDTWEVERARQARLERTPWRRLFRWMPQVATAIVVMAFAIGGYRILQDKQQQEAMAPGVALAKTMATLPHPDTLRDFNAIQSLAAVPHPVDYELLEALE